MFRAGRGCTFDGYRRANGTCGTANYWIVVPLVFCENRNLAVMQEALVKGLGYDVTSPYTDFVRRLATAPSAERESVRLGAATAAAELFRTSTA